MTIYTKSETLARNADYCARHEKYTTLQCNGFFNVETFYIARIDKDMQLHIIKEYSSKKALMNAFNRDYA